MPEGVLLPARLWVLTLWTLEAATAWHKSEMPSESLARKLESVYVHPQAAVALRVGSGTLLRSWFLNNCTVQHFSDGGLVVTGHNCENVPKANMTTWSAPATGIGVYHTSVKYITQNTFAGYTPKSQVEVIEIIQNKISTVKSLSFVGFLNVTFLSLSDNPIKFVSTDSFVGLTSLKTLVLFRTRLHEFYTIISSIHPTVLPSLEILNLGNTAIYRIEENDLAPMVNSSLKHLQLHLCDSLAYIHPRALRHLTKLEGFYLRDNLNMEVENIVDVISNITQKTFRAIDVTQPVYKTVPYTIFEAVSHTTAEVVIFNRMTDYIVTKDSFPIMNRIRCIVLESGKIREFKPRAFENLPNLEEISFIRNLFLGVPPGMQEPRLKFLDLSGYDRGFVQLDLPDYVFSKMVNLRELYFRFKALPSLTEFTFWGLKKLENLDMRKCSIDSLPEGVFQHLTNLKHLDLSENGIFKLDATSTPNVFEGMTILQTLLLSDTRMVDLEKSISFRDLPGLKFLDVSNNSIARIPNDVFLHNPNLEHLDLGKNIISDWSPSKISLKRLQRLDLSLNRFRTFGSDAIQVFKRLRHLDISRNPFACTCTLRPFLAWLGSTNVTLENLAYDELHSCSEPHELAGRPIRRIDSLLQRVCKPTIIISVVCVAVLVLVFIILLIGGHIYKHRFQLWLRSQSASTDYKMYLYDAFVSYSNSDTQWVISRLLPQLECSSIGNLKLCVYDRDFVAGRNISECILDSIKHSRKIILVLSNSFLQSPWCKFETDLAQYTLLEENRDAFILLKISRLDESLLSPKLNYLLKTRIHLSWSHSPKEETIFFSKLHAALSDGSQKPASHHNSLTKKLGFLRKLKKTASLV